MIKMQEAHDDVSMTGGWALRCILLIEEPAVAADLVWTLIFKHVTCNLAAQRPVSAKLACPWPKYQFPCPTKTVTVLIKLVWSTQYLQKLSWCIVMHFRQ